MQLDYFFKIAGIIFIIFVQVLIKNKFLKMTKTGLLERLAKGPVIGDGSMCMTLEKRGYCRAGPWTPEAVLLYPDAVRQLLREYLRAGADVLQTPCFYSSDGKLEHSNFKAFSVSFKYTKSFKKICVFYCSYIFLSCI